MIIFRRFFIYVILVISSFLFLYITPGYAASGDILFTDDFSSKSKVDLDNTTAIIDTVNGEVRLPQITGSQSFDVFGDAMIVQNGNLIELYERGSDGKYQKITDYTDEEAIAITFSSQGYAHYVLGMNGSAYKMEFGAGDYIENPVYKLSGLRSAVSIAASEEKVFVGDTNTFLRYEEKDTILKQIESIDLDFNISQIATGPNQEIVVSGENAIHVFRMAVTVYVESPAELLSGADYGDYGDEEEIVALNSSDNVQIFKATGEILNINHADTVAVKALPGLVYVRDGTSITEYAFDGTQMNEVNKLTGLNSVNKYYLSPREYFSNLFTFPDPCKRFRVMASIDTPDITSVNFYISSNGIDYYPVINGLGETLAEVNQLIVKAVLGHAGNQELTPKINALQVLDGSLIIDKLETTEIVRNPGGNPPLPTELPVSVTGGYNFYIRVFAPGAETVWLEFSNGENTTLTEQNPCVFIGSHYFPNDIPIGTSITANVLAQDGSGNQVEREFPNHYYIADNIEENLNVFDTK